MKVKLGDIAELINGDRGRNYPSQSDIASFGDVPFINAGHLDGRRIRLDEMNYISQEKYENLNSGKFRKGDILYCLRGSLGKKAVIEDDIYGAIASSLVIIRLNTKKVDVDYLMFALDSPSIQEQLERANNGSSQPNLSAASVRNYDIDLPDKKLQIRISERLSKVRSVIDARKEEIALLDNLIKARFVEVFGDPVLNPLGWNTSVLVKNATLVNGRAFKQDELLDTGKYPVLRVGNFFSNRGWYYSNLELEDDKYCENGDLLYAWSASFGPQIWTGGKVIYHYHIWKVLVGEAYNKQFLCKLLDYQTESLMGDTHGIAMMHLTKSGMEQTEFIVPPIELQEQFAAFVAQIDKSKLAVQKSLEETQKLFDSLMQQYFG